MYFFLEFINRKNSTKVVNELISNDVSIPNFHEFPLMIRLTKTKMIRFEEQEKKFRFLFCLHTKNPNISDNMITELINHEICDPTKHFPSRKQLIYEQVPDYSTFIV